MQTVSGGDTLEERPRGDTLARTLINKIIYDFLIFKDDFSSFKFTNFVVKLSFSLCFSFYTFLFCKMFKDFFLCSMLFSCIQFHAHGWKIVKLC